MSNFNSFLKAKGLLLFMAIALAGSIAAIIVLSIALGKAGGRARSLKIENSQLGSQITNLSSASRSGEEADDQEFFRRDFVSHKDGMPDSYLLVPPKQQPLSNKYTLIVYLHGMGSNYLEPYVVANKTPIAPAIREAFPSAVIASLNYRRSNAWGNELALADINQNITEISYTYPLESIIVMGTSMGGSVALNYPAVAPDAIRDKIRGVVSVEGTGDLAELFRKTKVDVVRLGVAEAMGGAPEQTPENYKKSSLLQHIEQLPKAISFAIVSAKKDKTVPPVLQKDAAAALEKNGFRCRLTEIDLDHEFPDPQVYVDALKFVVQNR
ncbi:MAG TPA: prolyl oligopeptidase family serine peptidase [Candidatus Melainabacteria bacterium]|nr:prolyl oligopeptidase family serine peptidase [Candidatus Melainabacteria bacterium]